MKSDDPIDTQAKRRPRGEIDSDGLANAPQDASDGTSKPQDDPMDWPGTEAKDDPGEPMSSEPVPVAEDGNRRM